MYLAVAGPEISIQRAEDAFWNLGKIDNQVKTRQI
jgi:hypothetical protein